MARMSTTVILVIELIALVGHAIFWIACVNRIHSTHFPPKLINFGANGAYVVLFFLPGLATWWFFREGIVPFGERPFDMLPSLALVYLWFCTILCLFSTLVWTVQRLKQRPPVQLLSTRVSQFDLREIGQPAFDEASWISRLLVRMPFNEMLRPKLIEYEVLLPRLPKELDGFVITHFTDMHANGQISWRYFQEMVELSNRQQPDLVAVTGDFIERTSMARQVAETLSQLRASVGRYFVLGNHDRIIDYKHLRRCLSQVGLTDLSGYCEPLVVRGQKILIAGNEAPWFVPSGDINACYTAIKQDLAEGEYPLRIVLAHSPDQIDWAVAKDVDLMIAGHLHGGQICLPWIGPLRSPSRYGFKYIGGVYYREPTLLCVSRGISAQFPFRWNCPPELVKLVLRSEQGYEENI